MKTILFAILGIVTFIALIFGLQALDYGSLIFWGTKYENAHREIFEQTKSFRDGSARDLDNLRIAYLQAKSSEEKSIIKDTIRHRADGVPADQLSPAIQQIINSGE